MSNWKTGMKVVCVDDAGSAGIVTKGRTYTVVAVTYCCGDRLDLHEKPDTFDGYRICGRCRRTLPRKGYNLWAYRFRPIDSLTAELACDEAQRADRQEQQFKPELA